MQTVQGQQHNRGLSLIELMVALGIGAFLIAGVVSVFLSSKESSEVEGSLARLQENGRFALDMIAEDLRATQYLGCNTGDARLTVMATDTDFEGVRGYERDADGDWAAVPVLPDKIDEGNATDIESVARPGSDVISLQMGVPLAAELTAPVDSASTSVAIDDNPGCGLQQGTQVILAGCLTAHLFQITNTQAACDVATPPNAASLEFDNTGNTVTAIDMTYSSYEIVDSELMLHEDRTWYVADTGRDINGIDVFALYRDVGGNKQEMIEGVEYMQIQFGQRIRANNNMRFVDPSDAELNTGDNYDGVSVVRVSLLMQSFNSVRDEPDTRAYQLLGESYDSDSTDAVHSGGFMMRQVFNTTVALRNTIDFE